LFNSGQFIAGFLMGSRHFYRVIYQQFFGRLRSPIKKLSFETTTDGPPSTKPRTGAIWMSEGLPPIREQSFIGLLEPVSEE
jgi:hypothetical protein